MPGLQEYLAGGSVRPQEALGATQMSGATTVPQTGLQRYLGQTSGAGTQVEKKPFIEREGIVQHITKPVIELGKDIARLLPSYRAAEESESRLRTMIENLKYSSVPEDRKKLLSSVIEHDMPLEEYFPDKKWTQYAGDIAGSILLAVPVGGEVIGGARAMNALRAAKTVKEAQAITKAMKPLTAMGYLKRGSAFGGMFGAADALSRDLTLGDAVKDIGLSALFGGVGDVTLHGAGKVMGRVGSGLYKVAEKAGEALPYSIKNAISSRAAMLRSTFGVAGKEAEEMFGKMFTETGEEAGKRAGIFENVGYGRIDKGREVGQRLSEAVEGKLVPKLEGWTPQRHWEENLKKLTPDEQAVAREFRSMQDEDFIRENLERGLTNPRKVYDAETGTWKTEKKSPLTRGEIESYMRQVNDGVLKPMDKPHAGMVNYIPNHMPHLLPSIERLKKDFEFHAQAAYKDGAFDNMQEARDALAGLIELHEGGGFSDEVLEKMSDADVMNAMTGKVRTFIGHFLKTGQAKTAKEALGKIRMYFENARAYSYGPLKYGREVNMPFYERDFHNVLTGDILGHAKHFTESKYLGRDQEKIAELIGRVELAQGKDVGEEFKKVIDTVVGKIDRTPAAQRALAWITNMNVLKLTFSAIPNLAQNLNSLLASDLKSFAKGIGYAFSQEGKLRALETGATFQKFIEDSIEKFGLDSEFARKYLKFFGFTRVEMMNRTIAANTGIEYASDLFLRLKKNPADKIVRERLKGLGLDADDLLESGKIPHEDLMKAGLRFVEKTQFMSRPMDLPGWTSNSTLGKIMFQYKTFTYQQTRFLKDTLMQELKLGNMNGIARDLLILSAIFPMSGEVIGDLKSLVTNEKRPTEALDRYLENLQSVGGTGIIGDLASQSGMARLAHAFVGPTLGTGFEATERAVSALERGEASESDIRFVLRQTGLGRILGNVLYPNDRREGETFLETLKEL